MFLPWKTDSTRRKNTYLYVYSFYRRGDFRDHCKGHMDQMGGVVEAGEGGGFGWGGVEGWGEKAYNCN